MPVNSFENYPLTWKPDKKLLPPIYQSIASQLEYDVLNGYLLPNTKLPPQRELADFLDINLSTITRAFKICEMKGLIYAVIGSGTFVSPNAGNAIYLADNEVNKNYIEMGIIKPIDSLNTYTVEAIRKIAEKNYLDKLLDYANPLGTPYHRMAAKQWMQNFNMDIPVDNISVISGGQNAFTLALISLFGAGDKIAVDSYTYPNFIELANMLKIQLIPVVGDQNGMLPQQLDFICRTIHLQGIYLNPSNNNPTAVTMTMERRKDIAKLIKKYKLILLEDDIYSFLGPKEYLPISHFVPEQFVYMHSISKSLCSGMRVGYIAYSNIFAEKLTRGIYNINVKTPALNAEIVTELINSGKAGELVSKKREISKERNDIYKEYFSIENPFENPLSFFRWLPLPNNYNPKQFEKDILAQGVRIYHSYRFTVRNEEQKQFVRISLSSVNDSEDLHKGLKIIKNFMSI